MHVTNYKLISLSLNKKLNRTKSGRWRCDIIGGKKESLLQVLCLCDTGLYNFIETGIKPPYWPTNMAAGAYCKHFEPAWLSDRLITSTEQTNKRLHKDFSQNFDSSNA